MLDIINYLVHYFRAHMTELLGCGNKMRVVNFVIIPILFVIK